MFGVWICRIGLKFSLIVAKSEGNISNSHQKHFCSNSGDNVSFSGKLGNFPEILLSQSDSVWCVDLWNSTEILIDCHIMRG